MSKLSTIGATASGLHWQVVARGICCVLLPWLLTSCNKPKHYYYRFSTEDKSYFDFGVGSWWVYVNDSTGEMDTVRVVQNDLSEFVDISERDNYVKHYEHLDVRYSSIAYPDGLWLNMSVTDECTGGTLNYTKDLSRFFLYSKGHEGEDCTFSGTLMLRTVGDTSIQGALYSSVYSTTDKFYLDLPTGDSQLPTSLLSPGVGMVHYHVGNTDTTWTLVSFHIQ